MSRTSVLIPCYREQKFLAQAVRSALDQTARPRDVIVIDDGSPVPITLQPELLAAGARIIRTENRGSGPARNAGLRECSGEFIAFLDADDHWAPTKLERQEACLDRETDAVLCYTRCVRASGYFEFGPYPPDDTTMAHQLLALWYGQFFPPSSVLVRREPLVATGGFDPDLRRAQDLELWFRLAAFGRFIQVPEPLCYYRVHEGQVTAQAGPRISGNALARRRAAVRSPEALRAAGIDPAEVDLAERNELLLAYYRREFSGVRTLLWRYFGRHPLDIRVLAYALVALLPGWLVRRLRGGVAPGLGGEQSGAEGAWELLLASVRRFHS